MQRLLMAWCMVPSLPKVLGLIALAANRAPEAPWHACRSARLHDLMGDLHASLMAGRLA